MIVLPLADPTTILSTLSKIKVTVQRNFENFTQAFAIAFSSRIYNKGFTSQCFTVQPNLRGNANQNVVIRSHDLS